MVFVQKWPFFQLFFLGNIGQENVFYDSLETKNAFLGYKNNKFKKVEKLTFFHVLFLSMVLVEKWPFSQLFFLGNIGQENVFYDSEETKNAFLGYKNNKLEKVEKLRFFQKGLTHRSGPKMAIFSSFFFRQYGPGKCLL